MKEKYTAPQVFALLSLVMLGYIAGTHRGEDAGRLIQLERDVKIIQNIDPDAAAKK